MNDQEFKKSDEAMMKKMEPLRSKEVSEGMLRGFSASVERRISTRSAQHEKPARAVWAPAAVMAVFVLFVVLKSGPVLETAQSVSEREIQEEIALLNELGELDEEGGETLLEDGGLGFGAEMELT